MRLASRRIAEHEVVLHRPAHGRREIEIYCLIVRRLHRKHGIAGMAVGKFAVLIVIQNQEVDIGRSIRRAMRPAYERGERPVKVRLQSVRRNFEGDYDRVFQVERPLKHLHRFDRYFRRGSNVIRRRDHTIRFGRIRFGAGHARKQQSRQRKRRMQTGEHPRQCTAAFPTVVFPKAVWK